MGRKRNPIGDSGPAGWFAAKLRDRVDEEATTGRQLAAAVNLSHSTVSAALGGNKFPTWGTVKAIVQGCGADPDELDSEPAGIWHRPIRPGRSTSARTRALDRDLVSVAALAAQHPEQAAVLLTGMTPKVAAEILASLPPEELTQAVTAVLEMSRDSGKRARRQTRPADLVLDRALAATPRRGVDQV